MEIIPSSEIIKYMKIIDIAKKGKCFFCNKKIPLLWTKYAGKRVENKIDVFDPKYLFHVKETHGFSPEIFEIML